MTDLSGAVAASFGSLGEERTTRRDPDRRGTKPGRLTPKDMAETLDCRRSPGMDDAWRNRCLPPERLGRGGMSGRDSGRREKGNEDRSGAVAEKRF